MKMEEVKMCVLEAHEQKSRAARALEDYFAEGSWFVVLIEGVETFWEVEGINYDTLRIEARRDIGEARPLRAMTLKEQEWLNPIQTAAMRARVFEIHRAFRSTDENGKRTSAYYALNAVLDLLAEHDGVVASWPEFEEATRS